MNRFLLLLLLLCMPVQAHAFCGFFVAKAETDLFNEASKVVLSRSENRTVITMANDFKGDLSEFAIVIPVPVVPKKSQINIGDNKIIDHLDAYTAPRLVEYHDPNPCDRARYELKRMSMVSALPEGLAMDKAPQSAAALGVTIEAEYSVGEYDIVILSAEQSTGLLTYLNQEGYKLPKGADNVLGSYIKQDMNFFLAKVNIEEQAKSGYTYLRPLQVAYESEKFMLPIRLGTLNSNGPQDLILFTLTRNGRVEPANYRTTKIPSDTNIPLFVKDEFGEFYKAMFDKAVQKENMKTVFLEYAWDMSWCDPCAADPVPNADLRKLGVWWVDAPNQPIKPMPGNRMIAPPRIAPADVFVTRLHARYTADTFPEDIMLQETGDKQNFQGRYIMTHPWSGDMACSEGEKYLQSLPPRFEKEAKNLAQITGWELADIKSKMEKGGQSFTPEMPELKPWWERMWNED